MACIVGLREIPERYGALGDFKLEEETNFLGRHCHKFSYTVTDKEGTTADISIPVHRVRDVWSRFTGWIRELCGWESAWLSIDGQKDLERVLIHPKGLAARHTAWAVEIPRLAAQLIQKGKIVPFNFPGVFTFPDCYKKIMTTRHQSEGAGGGPPPLSIAFCRRNERITTTFHKFGLREKSLVSAHGSKQKLAERCLVKLSAEGLSAQALVISGDPGDNRGGPPGLVSETQALSRGDISGVAQLLDVVLGFERPY